MEFSNVITEDGLVQEIDRICGSTDAAYPIKAKTARLNQGLDRFFYLALTADGTWQFDDLNYAEDLPIGVTDVVSGQQDYTFATDVLMVEKALIKNNGEWQELSPVDVTEKDSKNIWVNTEQGIPTRYDKFANSLFLDPIPNYNLIDGLKVVFKRNGVKFLSTMTTTEPGVPNLFHPWLCQYASKPFILKNRPKEYAGLLNDILQGEVAIQKFFSYRVKDVKHRLQIKQEDNH